MMGRVVIPTIDVDMPIYHGTTEETLMKGVGHLYGTALPVGGAGTHSVLTAHSGLADHRMFTDLPDLELGIFLPLKHTGNNCTMRSLKLTKCCRTKRKRWYPNPAAT